MKDKVFKRLLFGVVIAGAVITAAFVAYTLACYLNASIIAFIANEWWRYETFQANRNFIVDGAFVCFVQREHLFFGAAPLYIQFRRGNAT